MTKWCEHINIFGESYLIRSSNGCETLFMYDFKFCPICGTPRPTTKHEYNSYCSCADCMKMSQTKFREQMKVNQQLYENPHKYGKGSGIPVEKKVEFPLKISVNGSERLNCLIEQFNQLIDYLSSKPWEKP